MPMVTSVWRRSSPSMRRKTAYWRTTPIAATTMKATMKLSTHQPVVIATP
jgi:hypothetical protein